MPQKKKKNNFEFVKSHSTDLKRAPKYLHANIGTMICVYATKKTTPIQNFK